jgi:tripeptide aminopeptidase
MKRLLGSIFLFSLFPSAWAQVVPDVKGLLQQPAVKAALESVKTNEPAIIEEQIRLSEIPAPSFQEDKRGTALKQLFTDLKLKNVRVDKAGNVVGERSGLAPRPNLVFAAHLDTVFPEGTNVRVSRQGNTLKGPGIGDDARGLALMIGVIKALDQAAVQTPGTITFVANVGEEGLGDLRGMKELFNVTLKDKVDSFISVDGTGHGITNVGVGSYRYRVAYKGPGGHSFGAFGIANPIHALGRAIAKISDFQVPQTPKTTFNVGRIGGGTSVNSIAFEAWMEMDMRSADVKSLKQVDDAFLKAIAQALSEENERWGNSGKLTLETKKVGDRPAGQTPENSSIVRTALAVTQALGLTAQLGEGSTDSNIPMNLKIPAITIGGGGNGSGAHSLNEQFDTTDSWKGTQRALLLAIALVQK